MKCANDKKGVKARAGEQRKKKRTSRTKNFNPTLLVKSIDSYRQCSLGG